MVVRLTPELTALTNTVAPARGWPVLIHDFTVDAPGYRLLRRSGSGRWRLRSRDHV